MKTMIVSRFKHVFQRKKQKNIMSLSVSRNLQSSQVNWSSITWQSVRVFVMDKDRADWAAVSSLLLPDVDMAQDLA